jgi:type III secretory pathway lipoprotein EscJ
VAFLLFTVLTFCVTCRQELYRGLG